jgi:hypothetical protein
MSVQHHASPEEHANTRRMLDEFLGNAKPRFPQGKISEDDEGELAFAVAVDPIRKVVMLRFSKPVDWLGMDKQSTLKLAVMLTEKANQL